MFHPLPSLLRLCRTGSRNTPRFRTASLAPGNCRIRSRLPQREETMVQQVWARTAEHVSSLSDPSAADDCGDAMALLAPVFQAWPDGQKAGAALAEILSVPAERVGAVSSWDGLMKHQEAILERVRFLRLKKLAAYYDAAAIRRAVKRNREKYGERYPDAEIFLSRLDEWEKKLGPLDRWVDRAGPEQADNCVNWWNCGKRPLLNPCRNRTPCGNG